MNWVDFNNVGYSYLGFEFCLSEHQNCNYLNRMFSYI